MPAVSSGATAHSSVPTYGTDTPHRARGRRLHAHTAKADLAPKKRTFVSSSEERPCVNRALPLPSSAYLLDFLHTKLLVVTGRNHHILGWCNQLDADGHLRTRRPKSARSKCFSTEGAQGASNDERLFVSSLKCNGTSIGRLPATGTPYGNL